MNEMDELVEAAERLHGETGKLAVGARRWRRLRQQGQSLTEIVRSEQNRVMLNRAASVARAAASFLHCLRLAVVRQLSAEGWSRRQLAGLIGVTHQRVSKIARPDAREPALTAEA